ncbi:solute carrier organic anion transporter family member 5A1 [Lates japonicus]|uniref:Solute carrier organic anion transporter family member 5A1 n=1 Tax=Lates japonicus TaxID=270547 RepID=A0AAD3R0J5_LATJO|nr:solute carrier organic anion transporter family member 5A1 [Lates japonicus]
MVSGYLSSVSSPPLRKRYSLRSSESGLLTGVSPGSAKASLCQEADSDGGELKRYARCPRDREGMTQPICGSLCSSAPRCLSAWGHANLHPGAHLDDNNVRENASLYLGFKYRCPLCRYTVLLATQALRVTQQQATFLAADCGAASFDYYYYNDSPVNRRPL